MVRKVEEMVVRKVEEMMVQEVEEMVVRKVEEMVVRKVEEMMVQEVEEMVVRKVKEMEDEVEDVDVDVVEAVRQVVEVTVVFLDTLEPIPQLMTVLAALTVFVHRV